MKYIKLFEQWQWLNREEGEGSTEREYLTTVDALLTWAAGPEWSDDWSWAEEMLMVDEEWLEGGMLIGYGEELKRNRDAEIEVYSQQVGGQVESTWSIGLEGVEFGLITWSWPFEEEEEVTSAERDAVARVERELAGDPVMGSTNSVDIIDWVQHEVRREGRDPDELTSIGFKNWFLLQRAGSN